MIYLPSLARWAWVAVFCMIAAPWARGTTITFNTPFTASDPGGNPINATVIFQSTSQTQLMITLRNLQANPHDDGQMLVDFSFSVNQSLPGVSMSSSAAPIDIESGGDWCYTIEDSPHNESTLWDLSSSAGMSSTFFAFCDNPGLAGCAHHGTEWPERGLIGPPNAQNRYSSANGSITSGAHEPVLSQSATFLINLPVGAQLLSNLQISAVTFAFGTLTSPQTLGGVQTVSMSDAAVPEPGQLWMIAGGLGLMLIGALGRRRSIRQNAKRNPN
jgi:hypothetical protein